MKIYIAGQITGLEWDDVVANFAKASKAIKDAGHEPLSPIELFPANPIWDWAEYMLADLRIIWHHADAVMMLDNWKNSKGATLEHHAAQCADKPIFYSIEGINAQAPN